MDRKIGKKYLLVALSFLFLKGLCAEPSISLRITDQEENPLQQAGIEVPFLIHVEVLNNERKELESPQFSVPPQFEAVHRGTKNSMRSINGQTLVKQSHIYVVVAHEEGSFKIGPATLRLDGLQGKQIASNIINLSVSAEQKGSISKENSKYAFLEMVVSDKEPYVGQVITVYIRFYFAKEGIHLDHIQEPIFSKCKTTPLVGPKTGMTTLKGIQYQYLDWQMSLYALEPGKLVLPSLAGQISIPVSQRSGRDLFSLVNSMFAGVHAEKIYSNAVTLQIKPLPAHEPPVTAVGNFTSFNAKIASDKAVTGEGITLTLELVGQGNVMALLHPQLVLPEGLKYYDSHTKENLLTDVIVKKDFEYVVQALKPGTFIIPEQTMYYFDIKTKSYKSLRSRSLKITVSGELKQNKKDYDENKEITFDISKDMPPLEKTIKSGGFYGIGALSWKLFIILILFLMIPFLWIFLKKIFDNYQNYFSSEKNFKKAFFHARNRIKESKKNKKASDVYHIFMDLFSTRLKIPKAELSENNIEKFLKNAGFSDEKIQQWRNFFSHVMAVTFSALPHNVDLYEQIDQWIDTMELFL